MAVQKYQKRTNIYKPADMVKTSHFDHLVKLSSFKQCKN